MARTKLIAKTENPCEKAFRMALYYFKDSYPHPFADTDSQWGDVPRTIVEQRMCTLSATLRDKPQWYDKVCDPSIRAKWREEALEQARANEPNVDQPDGGEEVVKSLNEYAKYQVLTESMIDYVLAELKGFAKLRDPETGIEVGCYERVWKSDSLIPEELHARLLAAVAKLEDIPEAEKDWHPGSEGQVLDLVHPSLYPIRYGKSVARTASGSLKVVDTPPLDKNARFDYEFLSEDFQWLPSDFAIDGDGKARLQGCYINNIHPSEQAGLYPVIEDLVGCAVPLWERVLSDLKRPLTKPRTTTGCVFVDEEGRGTGPPYPPDELAEAEHWDNDDYNAWYHSLSKRLPDVYGEYDGALDMIQQTVFLAEATLQVIVKLANIVLTPANSAYEGGSWHVEGMLNEGIVSTFIYYYDEENITETHLDFRTSILEPEYHDQDDSFCANVLYSMDRDSALVEEVGRQRTCQGRCIAFPNIYQHQVQPFGLKDASKPGHRKIVALFLINPDRPVPSTTTVPPQQEEWVNEAVFDEKGLANKLPTELISIIADLTREGTMSREEAETVREKLMAERSNMAVDHTDKMFKIQFNMCISVLNYLYYYVAAVGKYITCILTPMPSVAEKKPTVDTLAALFPLTFPVPTPRTHPELVTVKDLHREEDLLRNPQSFRAWWSAIHSSREAYTSQIKTEPPFELPSELAALIGPLSTPLKRISLQRLTYLYESALVQFPTTFKLWKSYLTMRMSYVLGTLVVKKRAGGKKKLPDMKDALEDEKDDLEDWTGGLDGVVGWPEWKSLVATFERALMYLPKLPRLWLMYLSIFFHPSCPPQISHTHARHTFDRALRTLPPSLHHKIWVRYLLWAETRGGSTMVAVYRRYLSVDPSVTEHFTKLLLDDTVGEPRPLQAAKLLLSLARKAARGEYTSPEGKSPYQLLGDWIEVVEAYPEQVGLDVEELDQNMDADTTSQEDEDPRSPRKLNIEQIIQQDGLALYKDQAGRLWTGLATYWTKRGEFDRAKDTFEHGISSVLTIRDFTQIFDAYAEFCESVSSALMEALADEEDEAEAAEMESDLDSKMKEFEELMDRRPFLVNEVLIRRNPHDVQEWEKRVALWGEDDEKVAETYTKALETIYPRKATANLHRLYINFAKYYEDGGASGSAEPDLENARKILEKATKVNFTAVEDLAEIWCEWAELEIRHENYDESIRVMQRAAAIPKNTRINYHDHTLSAQTRLFKSLKLWSFYVDLEESIGSVETAKSVYDKILELRIANAQIIVNYAAFLEENDYFEESFKVYERGVELFTFPVSFEIWNIYLSKFIKRFGGSKLERARDLFEQALEKCPPKSCKPLFLMYAQMEEDYGLAKRAMGIFDRAAQVVQDEDKFEMFSIYIAKATANYGLPATRPIYERALEVLPDRQTAEMCLRFAALERKLGEIDRARAVYAHASQFCDPRVHPQFWAEWNSFEIDTGSEDTFREMLRIKRSVQAQFNTEASYLAAQTMAARLGAKKVNEDSEDVGGDAMAMADKQANGPSFVAAKQTTLPRLDDEGQESNEKTPAPVANTDEIQIDDEDM